MYNTHLELKWPSKLLFSANFCQETDDFLKGGNSAK